MVSVRSGGEDAAAVVVDEPCEALDLAPMSSEHLVLGIKRFPVEVDEHQWPTGILRARPNEGRVRYASVRTN